MADINNKERGVEPANRLTEGDVHQPVRANQTADAGSKRGNKPAAGYYNYVVSGYVPAIAQPTPLTCWAAALTMMLSWRDQRSGYTIEQAVNLAGPRYASFYRSGKGLPASEKSGLLDKLKMSAEPPVNYSVGRIRNLLQSYGPLWVTTKESPSGEFSTHARILEGLMGFKEPDVTLLYIVDPQDGKRIIESFVEFMRKFEAIGPIYPEEGPPIPRSIIQVVHFKKFVGKLEELPMGKLP